MEDTRYSLAKTAERLVSTTETLIRDFGVPAGVIFPVSEYVSRRVREKRDNNEAFSLLAEKNRIIDNLSRHIRDLEARLLESHSKLRIARREFAGRPKRQGKKKDR